LRSRPHLRSYPHFWSYSRTIPRTPLATLCLRSSRQPQTRPRRAPGQWRNELAWSFLFLSGPLATRARRSANILLAWGFFVTPDQWLWAYSHTESASVAVPSCLVPQNTGNTAPKA
jgi:hypothetical protein